MPFPQKISFTDDFNDPNDTDVYGWSPALYHVARWLDGPVPGTSYNLVTTQDVRPMSRQAEPSQAAPYLPFETVFSGSPAILDAGGRGGAATLLRRHSMEFGEMALFPDFYVTNGSQDGGQFFITMVARAQGGSLQNLSSDQSYYTDLPECWIFAHFCNGDSSSNPGGQFALFQCNGGSSNTTLVALENDTTGHAGTSAVIPPEYWRRPRRMKLRLSDAGGGNTLIECLVKNPAAARAVTQVGQPSTQGPADLVMLSYTTNQITGDGRWGFSLSNGRKFASNTSGAPYVKQLAIRDSSGTLVFRDKFQRSGFNPAVNIDPPQNPGDWAEGLLAYGQDLRCYFTEDEGTDASSGANIMFRRLGTAFPLDSAIVEMNPYAAPNSKSAVAFIDLPSRRDVHVEVQLQQANDVAIGRNTGVILRKQPISGGYALNIDYDGSSDGVLSIKEAAVNLTSLPQPDTWDTIAEIIGPDSPIAGTKTYEFEALNIQTPGGLAGTVLQVKSNGVACTFNPIMNGFTTLLSGQWLYDTRANAPQEGKVEIYNYSDSEPTVNGIAHCFLHSMTELDPTDTDIFDEGGTGVEDPTTIVMPSELEGADGTLVTPETWPVQIEYNRRKYVHPMESGHVSAMAAVARNRRMFTINATGVSREEYDSLRSFLNSHRASQTPFTWVFGGDQRGSIGLSETFIVRFVSGETLQTQLITGKAATNELTWSYRFQLEELFPYDLGDIPDGETANYDYGTIAEPTGTQLDYGTTTAPTGTELDFGTL